MDIISTLIFIAICILGVIYFLVETNTYEQREKKKRERDDEFWRYK